MGLLDKYHTTATTTTTTMTVTTLSITTTHSFATTVTTTISQRAIGPWRPPFEFPLSFEEDAPGSCPKGWTCTGKNAKVCNVPFISMTCNHPGLVGQHGSHYLTVANDFDTGNVTSGIFVLPEHLDRIHFRRSGGADKGSGFFLKRAHDHKVLCAADNSGANSNIFVDDACTGLSQYVGQQAYILLSDSQSSSWGKVLIDDIRLQNAAGMDIDTRVGALPLDTKLGAKWPIR